MSSLGTLLTIETQSPGRINAKTVVVDTGTNINSISVNTQVPLALPTVDGGGLLKGILYYADYDGSLVRQSWKAVFKDHYHTGANDGGDFVESFISNSKNVMLINMMAPRVSSFHTTFNGSGSFTDTFSSTDYYMLLATGATSGNDSSGKLAGVKMDFSKSSLFQLHNKPRLGTSEQLRVGINVDQFSETQSTSRGQYGLEACTGSSANWFIITANGGAGSLLQTATSLAINTEANYKLLTTPGVETRFYKDGVSQGASGSGSTPSSGSTEEIRLFVISIETSTGAAREWEIRHIQVIGRPGTGEMY